MNGKQAATRRPKMAERAKQLREVLFPQWEPPFIWDRKTNDGFTTVPRVLPIVMQAIDDQSKGTPAGHTYFGLWARSPDHALVTIDNQATFAAEAGFSGERQVDTWRRRMKQLRELGFIRTKDETPEDFQHVLIVNPILVMEQLYRAGKLAKALYARFIERLAEIGARGELDELQKALDAAANAAPAAASSPPPPAAN